MADKKKKGDQEEDFSTEQLSRLYKKKCDLYGVPICKIFKDRVDTAVADGEHLEKVHLWELMGPVGVRTMMESFTEVSYKHLKSLRLWKVKTEDEGVRAICIYINKMKQLEVLDLLDNEISLLGCQFLSKILHTSSQCKLIKLKLDHNNIGDQGLSILTQGLASNDTIEKISLNYCGITAEGSKFIQQILSNINTKLYKLKLQGNLLKNEGCYELFRAIETNNTLEKLKLGDNQFYTDPADPSLIDKIVDTMTNNTTLGYYDLKFNTMSDQVSGQMLRGQFLVSNRINDHVSQALLDKLKTLTKKRKPKKKKKGKKKKK